jgi:MoaA/NifB/PqqE/SkfB family radical SAM enzyme
MHATLPQLRGTDFPPLRRRSLTILQVKPGYRGNQSCLHCHVNAGPGRTEQTDDANLVLIRGLGRNGTENRGKGRPGMSRTQLSH